MIFSAPDPATDPSFAAALLALQHAAYALEADLVGDDRLPPLLEDEHALCAFRGRWTTAWDGVELSVPPPGPSTAITSTWSG